MRAMMAIYSSEKVPGVRVPRGAYGGTAETRTDEEGYFSFALPIIEPLPETTRWETVTISTPERDAQQPSISVPIIAPAASDIADTVVETVATNFVKNWRRVRPMV